MTDENILEIENFPADNRRQFHRRSIMIDIQFDGGDARGLATTRDIGIGGLYMATDARLPVGAPIVLRMKIGNRELIVKGAIAYCDAGHGAGVRFHNLSPEIERFFQEEMIAA